MPWGRWVQDGVDEVTDSVARQESDSDSVGSLFASRSDLIQGQIGGIPSVAAIYQRSITPFSVTRAQNNNAVAYVYNSDPVAFNPPRPDRDYGYSVISNVTATGTLMTFARSLIRTNGIDNIYQHENTQPGNETTGTFSIVGSGTIGAGEPVICEFGVIAPSSGTVNFGHATLWCVFTGSIL